MFLNMTDNLIFSVPHGLSIIASKRGAIAGIEALGELLNGRRGEGVVVTTEAAVARKSGDREIADDSGTFVVAVRMQRQRRGR